jgi:hypothetical protein
MWYLGNYTGTSVLDRVKIKFNNLELYNQTDLVWNFTLFSQGHIRRWISHDLDGNGNLEWIFWWEDNETELTVVDPTERQVWWSIPWQEPLQWNENYPPNYFDRCFADFTEDGIEDLVFPSNVSLCVINGVTGNVIWAYNYSTPDSQLAKGFGFICDIEVCVIDHGQAPVIVLTDYVSDTYGEVEGIGEYAFYLINGTTQEIKTLFLSIPATYDPFIIVSVFGALEGLAALVIIIVIVKLRKR